jgi:hypothetical protein
MPPATPLRDKPVVRLLQTGRRHRTWNVSNYLEFAIDLALSIRFPYTQANRAA